MMNNREATVEEDGQGEWGWRRRGQMRRAEANTGRAHSLSHASPYCKQRAILDDQQSGQLLPKEHTPLP
ncbi:unnamed protein product [Toxocara canis]|uniref:Uncharacterized protein n=1 Tax=Toxocara canis TaxID=6265 RepID=A0A183UTC7_TOXCA|nr:unnamed protein product [Toxocara canis]